MQCDMMLICFNIVSIFVIFVCQSGLTQNVELPPAEFPKDNATYKIYNVNSPERSETPPHVFPENDSHYKVIKNMTILKDLMSHASTKDQNQTKVDTEVPDLVAPVLDHENTSGQNSNQLSTASSSMPATQTQMSLEIKSTTTRDLEMDQEEIESDLSKTEDVKKNASATKMPRFAIHQDHDHPVRGSGPVLQGQLAAVLAGVFAMVAVASYVGLLTWRRYLDIFYNKKMAYIPREEKVYGPSRRRGLLFASVEYAIPHRYGNREMLINEEDQVNYNDMKNFEL